MQLAAAIKLPPTVTLPMNTLDGNTEICGSYYIEWYLLLCVSTNNVF